MKPKLVEELATNCETASFFFPDISISKRSFYNHGHNISKLIDV